MSKLEGITVCVNFSDYLSISLKENLQFFDNFIVVTSPSDISTQNLCKFHKVECVVTDAFYKGGLKLNKGAGINEGLKKLRYKQWINFIDSDIVLPKNFKEKVKLNELDIEKLYGTGRKFIWTFNDWVEYKNGNIKNEELQYYPGYGVGFWQLINLNSIISKKYNIEEIYPNSYNCNQVDIEFLKRYCPFINNQYHNLGKIDMDIIHLGPHGCYHNGRFNGNERFEELKNKTFFEIEDISKQL